MSIHKIYAQIFKIWRVKRMAKFEQLMQPQPDDIILDVGGHPSIWATSPQFLKRIEFLNIRPVRWVDASSPDQRITSTIGDGCAIECSDGSYDILFSNSVIEHVGDWNRQCAFANEARRVGKKLWIQTPALECPLEPHYLAPFIHWFPVSIRRRLLRWFTPWGWISKPTQEKVDETIAFTCLLTKPQMKKLFPDCVILTERLLWVFPKSYIAYRINSEQDALG